MLAEPPRHNPGHKLAIAEKDYKAIRFVPDQLDFGIWTSRFEAEEAFGIWLKTYQGNPKGWRSYCRSRGYESVNFNV